MAKVIISGIAHPVLEETLVQKGYEVLYRPEIKKSELLSTIGDAEGLVVTTRIIVDKEIIDAAPLLKWIARLGSGMELIDVPYAEAKGIKCVSSPEGNRRAVAEHCVGMLLNLLHKIGISASQVKNGQWLREENRGTELTGKTIGIIGYGNTGSQFAKLLESFDVTVLAYDKYVSGFSSGQIKEASLEKIKAEADIISFHVPLTEETKNMVNDEFLESLSRTPLLINSSRGKVVDLDAVLSAIKKGKISGAALDVLPNEKLDSYTDTEQKTLAELLSFEQVLVTPHIAGYSFEAHRLMSEVVLKKLGYL
jgi:D-3-phosphoglycerate dehydrogenase